LEAGKRGRKFLRKVQLPEIFHVRSLAQLQVAWVSRQK